MADRRGFRRLAGTANRENMRLMRCRRVSQESEVEEIAVSGRPKYRQRDGKRSNPFSTIGIDKFANVHAELSAKRKYIAQKTGAPEAMVRFVASEKGWIPVVLGDRDHEIQRKNSSGDVAGVSILVPAETNNTENGGELRRKDGESERISISSLDEKRHSLVMAWSQFLKNMAFGVLGFSAMWLKFVVCGVSYLAELFRNPNASQELIAEKEDGSRRRPRPSCLTVSAPTSPQRAHGDPTDFWATACPTAVDSKNIDPEYKHHQSKVKVYRRAVSMDNRPTRTERSESFYRSPMAYDAKVGATVMIFTLLFFVFYGPFCAMFFACAYLYLFTMFRKE